LDNSQPVYVIEQRTVTATERLAYVEQFLAASNPRDYPQIFNRRRLLEWMRTQGIDTNDIAVQAEVDAIGVALDGRSAGVGRGGDPSRFASTPIIQAGYAGRPWWLYAGCGGVALVIWLIGARLVARRRTLPYERTALPQPA
jgi:hypothetical protein